jgi:hypothetical protein
VWATGPGASPDAGSSGGSGSSSGGSSSGSTSGSGSGSSSGGSSGGVPAPAQAAGFTTPVLQADFTVPGNFWSNTANYITNCGAADSVSGQPSTWHFTNSQWAPAFNTLPCSRTSIMTDPTYGGQVLNQLLKPTDTYTDSNGQTQCGGALEFPAHTSQHGTFLPISYYIQFVFRGDAGTVQYTGSTWGHPSWWSHTVDWQSPSYVDNNDWELMINGPSRWFCGDYQEWPEGYQTNSGGCTAPGTPDITQYHTLEVLYTSDGSTKAAQCEWLDGALQWCNAGSFAHSTTYAEKDKTWDSSLTTYGGLTLVDENLYFKSIMIFSCANVGTSTCFGTVIDHWPFP